MKGAGKENARFNVLQEMKRHTCSDLIAHHWCRIAYTLIAHAMYN